MFKRAMFVRWELSKNTSRAKLYFALIWITTATIFIGCSARPINPKSDTGISGNIKRFNIPMEKLEKIAVAILNFKNYRIDNIEKTNNEVIITSKVGILIKREGNKASSIKVVSSKNTEVLDLVSTLAECKLPIFGYETATLFGGQVKGRSSLMKVTSQKEIRFIVLSALLLIDEPKDSAMRDVLDLKLRDAAYAELTVINSELQIAKINDRYDHAVISLNKNSGEISIGIYDDLFLRDGTNYKGLTSCL